MQSTEMESVSRNKEYIKLAIVVLVLLTILGGFLLYVSLPLLSSTSVVLATQPVDPFDLIRGQYIIIRYDVGTVPFVDGAEVGDNVYVVLEEDANGTSRYESASLSRPSGDNAFIKGQVNSIRAGNMRIEYGIEQYFFERGATFTTRGMEVEVKLSGSGRARINELLEKGEPIEMTYEEKTLTS